MSTISDVSCVRLQKHMSQGEPLQLHILIYDPPQMSLLMREVPPSWQSQSPGFSVARILTSSPKAFPPQLIDMGGQWGVLKKAKMLEILFASVFSMVYDV